MGRFSTIVHIKNNVDRMRFVNMFNNILKKRGFVPCSENEEALSYLFVFGDGRVTLVSKEYKDNPQNAYDDTRDMAKALKTSAFSVELVDSDFAVMTLCTVNGMVDRIVVGDGSGYGVDEVEGDRKLWEPLLAVGKTWEQFFEAAAVKEVFAEDALGKVAEALRIDPYYIEADYEDVLEKSDDDNIMAFYFKKPAESKTMTTNAAFIKVFGDALKPLGYQKIKSKYPYFVRVVSDEIIHVISYYNHKHGCNLDNNIVIKGGVATVYRKEIDLTHNPRRENWLTTNCSIYIYRLERNLEKLDVELKKQLYYHSSAPEDILDEMEYQLALTKRFMLPMLDKAVTIDSCIEHNFEIGMSLSLYSDGCFDVTCGNSYCDEGMLYFKTDWSVLENSSDDMDQMALQKKSFFEKNHVDFDLYIKAQVELERRKEANIRILKSYGLDL